MVVEPNPVGDHTAGVLLRFDAVTMTDARRNHIG
jgi:hypothetical protein